MKIAVTAWTLGASLDANSLGEQGEIAEAIGFDSFWLPESHFNPVGALPLPLMLLASVASRTEKIKLGSTSYLLPIRHPIHAAEEVAVLDRISNGRVILGVGRGFQEDMFTIFDIPTKDKRKLFKEKLDIMIDAWQGKPLPGSPEDRPITLSPLPVQQPHPPIWVAAFGPLALKQAGSLGLPYIASPMESMESLIENYERHQGHATDAGHGKVETIPVMRTMLISDNSSTVNTVKDALQEEARFRLRDGDVHVDDWTIIGDESYVADRIAEYKERLGLNYLIARGRITGIDARTQIESHERLAKLVGI